MSLADLANPYGSPSKNKWNLTPGAWINSDTGAVTQFFAETKSTEDYSDVQTALDSINDTGGRRLAVYEYPFIDGQRVKDLGRKGETYTFNIKFYGTNYQEKFKEFYDQVYLSNSSGVLKHPVMTSIRGTMKTRLQSFDPVHRADEFNSVTFRAVFIEDNTDDINVIIDNKEESTQSLLQASLQALVTGQAAIATAIASASALLSTPAAILAGINARLTSITGQTTSLLAQIGATYASTSALLNILSVASSVAGGVSAVSSGTSVTRTSTGATQNSTIPPVFQTGLNAQTQTLVQTQLTNFINANQVTPQQAVYAANQVRASITTAIAEVESAFGNYGYDIMVQYRALSIVAQTAVESALATAKKSIKTYTLPQNMSLRQIAFANGLSPDRQNDIEALNPFLPSINLVAKGSTVTVPVS